MKLLTESICLISQATKHAISDDYFDEHSREDLDTYKIILAAIANEKTKEIFKQYCGFSDEELAAVEEKWRNDNLWTKTGDTYELNIKVI